MRSSATTTENEQPKRRPPGQSRVRAEEPTAPDPQAQDEVRYAAHERLEQREKREHERAEALRDVFAGGVRWLVVLAFGLVILAIFAIGWHYLLPWPWLSEANLEKVTTVVFSGAMYAIVGLYIRDRI